MSNSKMLAHRSENRGQPELAIVFKDVAIKNRKPYQKNRPLSAAAV